MQLLKFLLGLLLVQGITAVLVLISANDLQGIAILRIALPLLFISLVVAFWFSSIANYHHKDSVEKVKSSFAKEREKIRVNAEKEKTKVVKEAQQAIAKEAKNTHAKANFQSRCVGCHYGRCWGIVCFCPNGYRRIVNPNNLRWSHWRLLLERKKRGTVSTINPSKSRFKGD